uniref:Uncharacterized protein n=1 Tax=Magallana gigas TaxID=29159 RepID=K1S571_MAGGI
MKPKVQKEWTFTLTCVTEGRKLLPRYPDHLSTGTVSLDTVPESALFRSRGIDGKVDWSPSVILVPALPSDWKFELSDKKSKMS